MTHNILKLLLATVVVATASVQASQSHVSALFAQEIEITTEPTGSILEKGDVPSIVKTAGGLLGSYATLITL